MNFYMWHYVVDAASVQSCLLKVLTSNGIITSTKKKRMKTLHWREKNIPNKKMKRKSSCKEGQRVAADREKQHSFNALNIFVLQSKVAFHFDRRSNISLLFFLGGGRTHSLNRVLVLISCVRVMNWNKTKNGFPMQLISLHRWCLSVFVSLLFSISLSLFILLLLLIVS